MKERLILEGSPAWCHGHCKVGDRVSYDETPHRVTETGSQWSEKRQGFRRYVKIVPA